MSTRFLFWLLWILWLVFGLIVPHASTPHFEWSWSLGGGVLEFILFGVLGLKVFGPPITNG